MVQVEDARTALALLSAAFYGRSADRLTIVGITGTKGKTTTAYILRSILTAAGCKTGMIAPWVPLSEIRWYATPAIPPPSL